MSCEKIQRSVISGPVERYVFLDLTVDRLKIRRQRTQQKDRQAEHASSQQRFPKANTRCGLVTIELTSPTAILGSRAGKERPTANGSWSDDDCEEDWMVKVDTSCLLSAQLERRATWMQWNDDHDAG